MPISIVAGGQFGSEGKGKVAHYFAKRRKASFVVRCGGPNSGHTVIDERGVPRIFQQLPTAVLLPDVKLAICAGSYINPAILLSEILETGVTPDRLFIDPDAVIITPELMYKEESGALMGKIGSTGSGTGAAVASRINREPQLLFAKNIPEIIPFIYPVAEMLRDGLKKGARVLIEGTQGFGLSPLHSGYYPFVTSRDTTAAAFLSETGLSPVDVDDVILTLRAFPIRVSGNSGLLFGETDWHTLTREGSHSSPLQERSSVTKHIRRVGRFDPTIVKQAIVANNPTKIVLNHLDYVGGYHQLTFFHNVERAIGQRIGFTGAGPDIIIPA